MQWAADGQALFIDAAEGQLRRVTMDGSISTLTALPSIYPHLSADGTRLYYSSQQHYVWHLRSMNVDGSGASPLNVDTHGNFVAPAPSPLGDRLVMVNAGGGWDDHLWTLDVATGTATPLNMRGHTPRWSPTGTEIGFLSLPSRQLAVMDQALTSVRIVSEPPYVFGLGISWSPDGQWLAGYNESTYHITLVHVASGLTLPLGFTYGMHAVAWRP